MSAAHPEWDGLIDPDETIIWQGAPDGKFRYEMEHPLSIVIGLGIVAMSAPNLPSMFADRNPFIIFPSMFFCVGIYSLIGSHIYDAWKRQGTFYTLTTKRAFIGSRDYKGKTLDSYFISPENRIRLKEGKPASVYFAKETKQSGDSVKTIDIGFRYIDDAKTVLAHLRTIQNGDPA